jgi:hypothetical protein
LASQLLNAKTRLNRPELGHNSGACVPFWTTTRHLLKPKLMRT